jgi:bla regulator protein BlaR1
MSALAALANHLWQSTLVSALVAVAVLACRHNRASVRHALWLAATLKFLVPFAALALLGARIAPAGFARGAQPAIAAVIDSASQPFTGVTAEPNLPRAVLPAVPGAGWPIAPLLGMIWLGGATLVLTVWGIRWRRVAALARSGPRIVDGPEVDALRRLERQAGLGRPMPIVVSPASCEPGVFGIASPVLLWPAGIRAHLRDDQLITILTHEVAHVRRRDNLTAAVQALVEALFWFHPLVWWIGARLVDERERACDEAVLQSGSEPQVYAETILTACRLYLEAPRCVAGVAGSNLRTRIERIMLHPAAGGLTLHRKLLLAAASVVVIATPVVVGALTAAPHVRVSVRPAEAADARRVKFEIIAIKANASGPHRFAINAPPGGRFSATNVTLRALIQAAYHLQAAQIAGGPNWLDTARFDLLAETDGNDASLAPLASAAPTQMQRTLQEILADRFKLVVRTETRDAPVYALTVARSDGTLGPGLRSSAVDCRAVAPQNVPTALTPPLRSDDPPPCGIRIGTGTLTLGGVPLIQVANSLSAFVGRTVVDRTGLTGTFDATVTWTPDQSIVGVLQEQLGLRLEPTTAPIDMLVIVDAHPPATN